MSVLTLIAGELTSHTPGRNVGTSVPTTRFVGVSVFLVPFFIGETVFSLIRPPVRQFGLLPVNRRSVFSEIMPQCVFSSLDVNKTKIVCEQFFSGSLGAKKGSKMP